MFLSFVLKYCPKIKFIAISTMSCGINGCFLKNIVIISEILNKYDFTSACLLSR